MTRFTSSLRLAGFVAQHVWLVQTGGVRNSFGLFLVLAAGLTGSWRLGLQIGVLNMFALGGAEYIEHRRNDPNLGILLTRNAHLREPSRARLGRDLNRLPRRAARPAAL